MAASCETTEDLKEPAGKNCGMYRICMENESIPPWEKENSSSKVPAGRGYFISWEAIHFGSLKC